MRALLPALLLAPWLAACGTSWNLLSVYRMEIQQGNYLTQEMVSQLQPGMTRDQVRFVLGTPLLLDIFHDDRWDYVYRRGRAGSREIEERRLSVFFENDRLVRVEGDVTTGLAPPPAPAAAPAAAPKPAAQTPAAQQAPAQKQAEQAEQAAQRAPAQKQAEQK
jgi:outer membrane protein assembly factor BamE